MDEAARRRSEVLGGWGALAQGALTIAAFAAGIAVLMTARGTSHAEPPPAWPVILASLVAVFSGLAQLAAVRGLRSALHPPSPVTWAASVAGWLGAAVLILGGLVGFYGMLTRAPATPVAIRLAEAAPLLVAVWAMAGMAAAWRAKRLPAWLRVAGVIFGAAVLASPAVGLFRPVALLAGLAFWFGLGVALLRDARFPHPPAASDTRVAL